MRITAAVAREVGEPLSLEELELEQPRRDEVLVRIVAAGICHTDISYRNGVYETEFPVVLGHEGAAVVEAVGDGVAGISAGDQAVLTYGTCGRCSLCRAGNPAYCRQIYSLNLKGNRPDGTSAFGDGVRSHFFGQSCFATHAVVPAANVVPVAGDADPALLGPLGCGVQTGAGAVLRSMRVPAGASLVIFGAGAVGLSALLAGVVAGAHPIIVVDRVRSRLSLAAELGATATIDAGDEDVVARIQGLTAGGADFAVEAAGAPAAFRQALASLGPLGVCGLVGGVSPGVEARFDWPETQLKGITIRGVIEGDAIPSDFIPQLHELHRRGLLPFERLVRFYDFAEINRAMDEADSGDVVKPILRMGPP